MSAESKICIGQILTTDPAAKIFAVSIHAVN